MSNRGLLAVALGLGLITSVLVYVYISGVAARQAATPTEEIVPVLVATQTLMPRTTLSRNMVRVEEVPGRYALAGVLHSPDQAVGRIVRESIQPGEQLSDSRLFERGQQPGLAFTIPPGTRAVTVAVNEVIGVAGFIKPGDTVDILATFDEHAIGQAVTVTLLQGVTVLAIAQDTSADPDERARVTTTVTLAVTLKQAERLTLASEEGRLRLALRPYNAPDMPAGGVLASQITGRTVEPEPQPARPPRRPRPGARPRRPQEEYVVVIRGTSKEVVELP